ncbi:hypothetical protein ACSBOB_11445 [Mesorhizobium sp. ASY16-5R]|uniref:hypothetical protein n=1 Tax=Mesorhizobium sp. ASY16-5R TaxID=3445772 RepID=UPI003F9EC858
MADNGRARKGKRTQIAGQWAWQLIEMKESPAFRALSLSARRVLDRLEIEIAHHGGKDNGKLPATFDQFAEYGVSRRLIAPAIREAAALGFVVVTDRGRAGNALWRRPSLYRLTYRPTELTEATDDWRKIATAKEADAIATAAREDVSAKTKAQAHKVNQGLGLKVNRSTPVYGAESDTTGHSVESGPTSISWGQGDSVEGQAGAQPTQTARASGLPLNGEALSGLQPIGEISDALKRSSILLKASKENRRLSRKIGGANG